MVENDLTLDKLKVGDKINHPRKGTGEVLKITMYKVIVKYPMTTTIEKFYKHIKNYKVEDLWEIN